MHNHEFHRNKNDLSKDFTVLMENQADIITSSNVNREKFTWEVKEC